MFHDGYINVNVTINDHFIYICTNEVNVTG